MFRETPRGEPALGQKTIVRWKERAESNRICPRKFENEIKYDHIVRNRIGVIDHFSPRRAWLVGGAAAEGEGTDPPNSLPIRARNGVAKTIQRSLREC